MRQDQNITKPLSLTISSLPEKPGVYQFFDALGTIIYIGKAKNLRKRVSSYFNKNHEDSPKTRILVKKIKDLKFIVVESEYDALLLENNLIKQFKPRYNVMLKDDKSYPCICIKKEPFPRVFQTRKLIKDGSEYYGPYASVLTIKSLLGLIRQLYPIRTCKLSLDKKSIDNKHYKVCLEYHIKRCLGPCVGYQDEASYMESIQSIREILNGNVQIIAQHLREKMIHLSTELRFEEAQKIKEKYDLIEQYKSKSTVVNSGFDNIDVFAYDETEYTAIINFLHVTKGCIVKGYTLEYRKKIEETKEEILGSAIFEFRSRFNSTGTKLLVPFLPDILPFETKGIVPTRGEGKKLLALSNQNVRQYKIDLLKQQDKLNPEQRVTRLLSTVKKDLQLKDLPRHIECFDNSNIQGTHPVASCVVFINGKAAKKEYRHFNIKTVIGPDDYASMEEVVFRRYNRFIDEEKALPELIIVDGGKGQLNAALKALKSLDIENKVSIIGIAKNLEELFFPYDSVPLYLDKNSETLKLIQQMRDEAHRFGITHHRNRRSNDFLKSELDLIDGIGDKTKKLLFSHFKSVKQIKEADYETLEKIVGRTKAHKIIVFLQK